MQNGAQEPTYYDYYFSDGEKEWRGGGARVKNDAFRAAEQTKRRHPHLTYTVRAVPSGEIVEQPDAE